MIVFIPALKPNSSTSWASLFATAIAIFSLFSCTEKSQPNEHQVTYSQSQFKTSGKSPQEIAFALSQGADWSLQAFDVKASKNFVTAALEVDPQNPKAQFLQIVNDLLDLSKGFYLRLTPLYSNSPKIKMQIEKELEMARNSPSFFTQWKLMTPERPEIKTETELQNEIDLILEQVEKLHTFTIQNATADFSITPNPILNDIFILNIDKNYADACELALNQDDQYVLSCPDNRIREEVQVNPADLGLLRMQSAYAIAYFGMLNSFDLSGFPQAFALISNGDTDLSPSSDQNPLRAQKIFEKAMDNTQFGERRQVERSQRIRKLGKDFLASIAWAANNSDLLCPKGKSANTIIQRPGNFFPKGFCLDHGLWSTMLFSITDFVGDQPASKIITHENTSSEFKINWLANFDNATTSLRNMGPFKFDKCGNVIEVGDSYLAGTFPNGDANKYLALESSNCAK